MQDVGDGPQLVSALAHFEMAVDQIEYCLPLSAEATRMFQTVGINQIICDINAGILIVRDNLRS